MHVTHVARHMLCIAALALVAGVSACASATTSPPPGGGALLHISQPRPGTLELSGRIEAGSSVADEIIVRASVKNVGLTSTTLQYGACSVHVRAYLTAERTGTPVFDGVSQYANHACIMIGYESDLAPGQSVEIGSGYARIPAGTLPAGQRYYLSVEVSLNGQSGSGPAGFIE